MSTTLLGWARRLRRAARGDDHGAAVVEFAIVVPVLMLIVFAVIDFGRAMWTLNVLSAGVREGARTAAAYFNGSANVTPNSSAAQTAIKSRVTAYINGALGGNGGTISNDNVCAYYDASTGLVTVKLVTSAVTEGSVCPADGATTGFAYTPITPYAGPLITGYRFQPRAVFRWELAPS